MAPTNCREGEAVSQPVFRAFPLSCPIVPQPDVVLAASVWRAHGHAVAVTGAGSFRRPRWLALALVLAVALSVVTVCCCVEAFAGSGSGTAGSSTIASAEGADAGRIVEVEHPSAQIVATTGGGDDRDHATEDCGRESHHRPDGAAPRGDVVGTPATVSGAAQSSAPGAVSLQRGVAAAAKPRVLHLLCVMRT